MLTVIAAYVIMGLSPPVASLPPKAALPPVAVVSPYEDAFSRVSKGEKVVIHMGKTHATYVAIGESLVGKTLSTGEVIEEGSSYLCELKDGVPMMTKMVETPKRTIFPLFPALRSN